MGLRIVLESSKFAVENVVADEEAASREYQALFREQKMERNNVKYHVISRRREELQYSQILRFMQFPLQTSNARLG